MSEARPHLSIGEVLSLLQDEFPDITISKIRFLESQGLLNPERTPSGYRKFYDNDVEQLRWVLRQQKENFLPLKVIKDRLAAGQLDSPASESGVLDLAPAGAGVGAGSASSTDTAPAGGAAPAVVPATAARNAPPDASARRSPVADAPPAAAASRVPAATDGAVLQRSDTGKGDRNVAGAPSGSTSTSTSSLAGPRAGAGGDDGAGGRTPPATPRAHPDAAVGSSASLTPEELCAATGVSPRLLAELERFGLVDGRALGADTVYDDEAMVICRLAATMAGAGIEARHLRMFKVAAEREAGLYEQLALPALRARRPEGRQEAVAQVTALTGTAAELHAALLRRALRGTFGPL